ncbi:MAG: prephenate dehydrogenase [Nitrospirota bacterium]
MVGVGLVGGSFAWGAKQRGLAREVIGVEVDPASSRRAVEQGVVDAMASAAEGVRGADVVVLAVPVGRLESVAREIAPFTTNATVVTDVGSVKAPVVERLEPLFARFVGGHPMAGGERSGVGSASAALFDGARCVLTPTPRTDQRALDVVERLWAGLGAAVVKLSPAAHDELVAAVSHVPHVAAAALVNAAAAAADGRALSLAAGGFRDTTRIASGAPDLWRDICLMNREPVLAMLKSYLKEVEGVRDAIERGDGGALFDALSRARAARDRMPGGEA